MPPVRTAHSSDAPGVPGSGKPVMDGGADLAALDGRVRWPVMARNEQDHPVAAAYCVIEPTIDRHPCAVQILTVEVEYAIGLDCTRSQSAVPARVKCRARLGRRYTR